ncbi:hypothetical protein Acid7E03_16250 [Acidisoma sp. 7E03]
MAPHGPPIVATERTALRFTLPGLSGMRGPQAAGFQCGAFGRFRPTVWDIATVRSAFARPAFPDLE